MMPSGGGLILGKGSKVHPVVIAEPEKSFDPVLDDTVAAGSDTIPDDVTHVIASPDNAHDPLRYCYAVILSCDVDSTDYLTVKDAERLIPGTTTVQHHIRVIESMQRAGLRLSILERDLDDSSAVVVLVSAAGRKDGFAVDDRGILAAERRRVQRASLMRSGFMTTEAMNSKSGDQVKLTEIGLSAADEVSLTDACVRRALSLALTYTMDESNKQLLSVERYFPLHDNHFNKYLVRLLRKTPLVSHWRFWEPTPKEAEKFVDEIHCHFGRSVALYFAFIMFYTRSIVSLSIGLVTFYLALRIGWWNEYVMALTLVGGACTCVWGPYFVVSWKRENARLLLRWNLSSLGSDASLPNPHSPEYELKRDPDNPESLRATYDPKGYRLKVFLLMPLVVIVNCIVMGIVVILFVQFWALVKMAPTCDCCEWVQARAANGSEHLSLSGPEWLEMSGRNMSAWEDSPDGCMEYEADLVNFRTIVKYEMLPAYCRRMLNCFASQNVAVFVTDRWYMVVVQGIVMGIVVDTLQYNWYLHFMAYLTRLESWPTEEQFDSRCMLKQFIFIWINMFLWYYFLAFVLVPNGPYVQEGLANNPYTSWLVLPHGWKGHMVQIDEAFVTPLIASSFINLLLDTAVPALVTYLVHRQTEFEKTIRHSLRKPKSRFGMLLSESQSEKNNRVNKKLKQSKAKIRAIASLGINTRLDGPPLELKINKQGMSISRALCRWQKSWRVWQAKKAVSMNFSLSPLTDRLTKATKPDKRILSGIGNLGTALIGTVTNTASHVTKRVPGHGIMQSAYTNAHTTVKSVNKTINSQTRHITHSVTAHAKKSANLAGGAALGALKSTGKGILVVASATNQGMQSGVDVVTTTASKSVEVLGKSVAVVAKVTNDTTGALASLSEDTMGITFRKLEAIHRGESTAEELWKVLAKKVLKKKHTKKDHPIPLVELVTALRCDPATVDVAQFSGGGVLRPLVMKASLQQKMSGSLEASVVFKDFRRFCLKQNLWVDYKTLRPELQAQYHERYGDAGGPAKKVKKGWLKVRSPSTFVGKERRTSSAAAHYGKNAKLQKLAEQLTAEAKEAIAADTLEKLLTPIDDATVNQCNVYPNLLCKYANRDAVACTFVKMIQTTPDQNSYDATDVLEQSRRTPFNTHEDYLDMVLQLGYMLQFTVAWPLTFLCALTNNYFEIHGDLIRCVANDARPLPRAHRSIRQWEAPLYWGPFLSIPISAALIAFATGQIDRFSDCGHMFKDLVMQPMPGCYENPLVRWIVWLVLMLVMWIIAILVFKLLDPKPLEVRRAEEAELMMRQERLADLMAPRLPDQLHADLQRVFSRFAKHSKGSSDTGSNGIPCKAFLNLPGLKALVDSMQACRGLPLLSAPQVETLFEYMDVLRSGEVHFADFQSGLADALKDYFLTLILQIDNNVALANCVALVNGSPDHAARQPSLRPFNLTSTHLAGLRE